MPDRFHQLQMMLAFALALICLPLYVFGPSDSKQFMAGTVASLIGFLIGKFSNGFQKKEGGGEHE